MNNLKITSTLNRSYTQKINFSGRDNETPQAPTSKPDEFIPQEEKKGFMKRFVELIGGSSTPKTSTVESTQQDEQQIDMSKLQNAINELIKNQKEYQKIIDAKNEEIAKLQEIIQRQQEKIERMEEFPIRPFQYDPPRTFRPSGIKYAIPEEY